MTSDPGAGDPPVTIWVRLAVAWLRFLRCAMRHRILPPDRVMALAAPCLRAEADAWLREQDSN